MDSVKLIQVTGCKDCPYYAAGSGGYPQIEAYCNVAEQEEDLPYYSSLEDGWSPDWCPLKTSDVRVQLVSSPLS